MTDTRDNVWPLITIVTVVYNAVEHVETTIRNVMSIGYPNLKNIIIDGGSTEGTVDIIKKYDRFVSYWVSEADEGIYDAFNKGWAKADAESYILYLGAGDTVKNLPKNTTLAKSQVVYGTVQLNDQVLFRSKADWRLRLGNTIHHQALMVKKSVHPNPPFDVAFKTYADFDFNQRMLKQGVTFVFDEKFSAYALPGGVSHRFNDIESAAVVKKNFGLIWSLLARIYYRIQRVKNNL